ncbi:MAG: hypothetical protein ACAH59_05205 [Pseudobdellovibrionaceae bacterium]
MEGLPEENDRIEIVTGLIMAFAGVVTSWCGYQAALWSGQQSALYTQANTLSVQASRDANSAGQWALVDITFFAQWSNAIGEQNLKLARFYEERFRPEFLRAFLAWKKDPKTYGTPFHQPEYNLIKGDEALKLETKSRETYLQGEEANHISDGYVRSTVLLAVVLMLVSNIQDFRKKGVRYGLLGVAGILLGYVIFHVASSPMLFM